MYRMYSYLRNELRLFIPSSLSLVQLLLWHFTEFEVFVSAESEQEVMIFPKGVSVGNSD